MTNDLLVLIIMHLTNYIRYLKIYWKYRLSNKITNQELHIFKLINNLNEYLRPQALYILKKRQLLIDEIMMMQESFIINDSLDLHKILMMKIISDNILYHNQLVNDGLNIEPDISYQISTIFLELYNKLDSDNYLSELEIKNLINKRK